MAYGKDEVMAFHKGGKVAVKLPKPLRTKDDLCLAYTPGVAHAVKAIAADCGFCSPSYFVKIFREHRGQTPLRFRKMKR